MTRSNLTTAEDRIRDLETAFTSLFPGIDLDTILSSIKSEASAQSSKYGSFSAQKKLHLAQKEDQATYNRGGSSSPAPESLPQDADGFDWSENAVSLGELSDGMAALSINPEGAGYLGKWLFHYSPST